MGNFLFSFFCLSFVTGKGLPMKIRIVYIVLAVSVMLLFICSDGEHGFLLCPFRRLTGWDCPFCGGQRMLYALLHGDVMGAFGYNPLLFLCSPLLLAWGLFFLFPSLFPRRFSRLFTDHTFFLLLFVFFLWGIIRNVYICV